MDIKEAPADNVVVKPARKYIINVEGHEQLTIERKGKRIIVEIAFDDSEATKDLFEELTYKVNGMLIEWDEPDQKENL